MSVQAAPVISADDFLDPARALGFDFYTGVPCSFLTPVINRVISRPGIDYIAAANEGDALAIAAGAWLAGRRTVVMCQNSGLGNLINPLTSLNYPFRIPTLMIVTWRGQPGLKDEPQHELMGRITADMLALAAVRHAPFPTAEGDVAGALEEAEAAMAETGLPFAFILRKGAVRDDGLDQAERPPRPAGRVRRAAAAGPPPARIEALGTLLEHLPAAAAVIATTGKSGRELFTLADRAQHLYQVGSMGCAASMGLGVALNFAGPVVVVDGDGAALMRLGGLATIGALGPGNLVHVILDNGVHDSTGGQRTVSASVDFAAIAAASGYAAAWDVADLAAFRPALAAALAEPGPNLVRLKVKPGSIAKLGRPTVTPPEVARRFRDFLADPAAYT